MAKNPWWKSRFFWNVQNCLEQQKFHVRHLWCSIETGGGTPSRRSSFECRDCRYFNEHVFVFWALVVYRRFSWTLLGAPFDGKEQFAVEELQVDHSQRQLIWGASLVFAWNFEFNNIWWTSPKILWTDMCVLPPATPLQVEFLWETLLVGWLVVVLLPLLLGSFVQLSI